jgi:hypothetical protein
MWRAWGGRPIAAVACSDRTPATATTTNPETHPTIYARTSDRPKTTNERRDVTKAADQPTVDVSNLCKHVDVTYNVSLGLAVQERFTAVGTVLVDTSANVTVFSMTAPGCTFSGCTVSAQLH